MAKKNDNLTLEEKLQDALVPDWERPHKVPENWVWTRLEALVVEIKNGITIKQSNGIDGCYVTRIESLQNNTIDFDRLGRIQSESRIKDTDWYKENDIALSHINSVAHIGKTALITEEMLPLVHGMNLLRLRFSGACLPAFFHYFSRSYEYKASVIERINMAVNQVSLNQKQLGNIEFPCPPLAEQQRIVARIESLFSKLDQAKELAKSTLDSFENRKAAILHKSFTGELTQKWREENSVCADSRPFARLSELCTSFQYGTSRKSERVGNVVVVRMGNLQDGSICWDDLVYSNDEEDNKKYLLKKGDVLFNRTNSPALVGKTAIYKGGIPAIFAGYLIRINYSDSLLGDYLNYMLNSPQAKEYFSAVKTDGVNQSNINAKKIAEFSLPAPSLPEQTEIVRVLDSVFAKEQQAKELASVIEKLELIKKAILARAFRGELGTNDPREESAMELLRECISSLKEDTPKRKAVGVKLSDNVLRQLKTDLEESIYRFIAKNQPISAREIFSVASSSKQLDVMQALSSMSKRNIISKQNDEYICELR